MTTKFSRAAAAVLIAPTVLLAAACGKADTTTTAPVAGQTQSASPSASAGTTSEAPATSAAPAPTSSDAGDASGGQAAGEVDKAEFIGRLKSAMAGVSSAHVDMQMSGQGQKVSVQGDTRLSSGDQAMKMSMSMAGMDIDMVVLDKKVYMKGMPGVAAGKWAAFDASSSIAKQMAASADSADPKKMFDAFEQGATKVKKVGTEKVDGEDMERYELTLDTKKALSASGAGAAGAAAGSMPSTITYDVWVDSKDHMRKVDFDVAGVKATVMMGKYGEPVDITAPPASQTVKGTM
ncbi:LppX_LprAFG lipoprotein [Terracoccus luteus]|uniref:LppX_LprAFG lipoprotein n=1 Tax=Terracoccus luteus TaxID=53356 RepID=A0A839Q4X9_9MICO|nr:LppX_LprAFG lipoprotein [Terracoccus luteus]MBB2987681.1 hypothetical protein [Terracoccus luteus]MCP2173332.1 hypothetical protein [Terracoccus luteus]